MAIGDWGLMIQSRLANWGLRHSIDDWRIGHWIIATMMIESIHH
jgi:hypothetical protein